MNTWNSALLCLLIFLNIKPSTAYTQEIKSIDSFIESIRNRYEIPGVALAVLKDHKVIHQNYYGYANLEHQVPVRENSLFRLYSLTKPIVSVGVFQLIEQGKVKLEDKISAFFEDLPSSWDHIEIQHLLTYSSGLPEMAQPYLEVRDMSEEALLERLYTTDLRFPTGERFEYSQTNFWLLQRLIEKLSGMSISTFIQQQFPEASDSVLFSSDARDIILNRATAYFPFAKGQLSIDQPYYQGDYSFAMNGLHLSLRDFMSWDLHFSQNTHINTASQAQMWTAFPYKNQTDQFTYGWGVYELNGQRAYGFSGSGSTIYRIFPEKKLSIIFLSNGFGRSHDLYEMINHLAYLVDEDLRDEEGVFYEKLVESWETKGIKQSLQLYKEYKTKEEYADVDVEGIINRLGYQLLALAALEDALKVFEMNVKDHPDSWNVYDSYGEALLLAGRNEEARKMYKKSLELNPQNERGRQILQSIP